MENEASYEKNSVLQNVLLYIFAIEYEFKIQVFVKKSFYLCFKFNFLKIQISDLIGLLGCYFWCNPNVPGRKMTEISNISPHPWRGA